jgi:hypothetical protein
MNSSLLRTAASDVDNNYLFGKFKGFTLKPLPDNKVNSNSNSPKVAYVHPVTKSSSPSKITENNVPLRDAPPPPVPKHQGVNAAIEKFNNINSNVVNPPALPPLNKGSTARPLISNPTLEATTCDAKELPSNIKYPTLRPAPIPPKSPEIKVIERVDAELPEVLINPGITNVVEKKTKDGTLSRIQSFLKKDNSSKQDKNQKQLKTFDKNQLKDIQISSPILITQVPLKDESNVDSAPSDDKKINRSQSVRDPSSPPPLAKPQLTSFGSMRNPRPKSIVDRPNLPPPPKPPSIQEKKVAHEYDNTSDVKSPGTPDNIYSVIEESPQSPPRQQGSMESMGLLGEIVNEIEHRKFDAIYIASTLKSNKKDENDPGYANVKTPVEDEYQQDSNASTTSSGYMRPINTPVARIPPSQSINKMPSTTSSNSLSSFKSAKSSSIENQRKSATSPQEPANQNNSSSNNSFLSKMKKSSSDTSQKKSSSSADSEYKTPTSNRPVTDGFKPSLKKSITPPSINMNSNKKSNLQPSSNSITKPKTLQKPANSTNKPTPSNTTASSSKATSSSMTNGLPKSDANSSAANSNTKQALASAASKKSTVAALQQKFESAK